jgi:dihydroorotate dehydrogenase electron transfer subunit
MKQYHSIQIASNARVSDKAYTLSFKIPGLAKSADPGQFVHIRLSPGSNHPLLRRPFSINDIRGDKVEILYEVKGSGTELLSQISPKDTLDVIGPLGKGFDIDLRKRYHLLVAGGMGIAPMGFLGRRLKSLKLKHELLYGCRSSSELIPSDIKICSISSDDGSCGKKGLVTSLLPDKLESCQNPVVYACGPWPMLKAVARICQNKNIPCQVSLESFMACGVGACQGCVVRSSDGSYISVCDKGPVFDSRLIDWDQDCVV